MFRGNHPAKVDEKGRLKLPAAFKQLLDAASVTQFYVTSENGKCAQIWPLPEWEVWEKKLDKFSGVNPTMKKLQYLTSYYGQQVEIDSQSRIVLPQILRSAAKLDAEVTVFGMRNYLEVHNREIFEQNVLATELTPDEYKEIDAILNQQK